jgi:hypothetical protein
MKKLAIFVEGQTELQFVQRYLEEIANAQNIRFGLTSYGETLRTVDLTPASGRERYFALIVDCSNDERVASALQESAERLRMEGYDRAVGLRDLYPRKATELPVLRAALDNLLRSHEGFLRIFIAIREVEAWFAQEEFHYSNISQSLDKYRLRNELNFDIDTESAEEIPHPARFLDKAYSLVGLRYRKKRHETARTVFSLDYANLYLHVAAVLPSLRAFTDELEDFLAA